MPSIPFVTSLALAVLAAAMQSLGHPVIACLLFVVAVGLVVVGEVERARDPAVVAPDAVWIRRRLHIYSTIDLIHSAQYGVATLTIHNRGTYPINVGATAQIKASSFPNNPIDRRHFSLRWHDDTTREVTIKPGRRASLLLGRAERTPEPDAHSYEWYTLSIWEFGREAAFASQLWPRKDGLRIALAVEVHCVPPANPEPTPALFELILVPPTADLEVRRI